MCISGYRYCRGVLAVLLLNNLALFGVADGFAQSIGPPPDSLLAQYSIAAVKGDYHTARYLIFSLRDGNSENRFVSALADMLEASVIATEQADYGDTLGTARFAQVYASSLHDLQDILGRLDSPSDSAIVLYALGTLEGARATILSEKRLKLKAIGSARRSSSYLRKAYAVDSTLVDALVGYAVHDFWVSHLLRFITWTPLIRDHREEAVDNIYLVAKKGRWGKPLAAASLVWVLIELERYLEAAELADLYLEKLGDVRSFLEPCGKAYYLAERWSEAQDRYQRLVVSIREAPRYNAVRETGALHRLAHIAKAREDWEAVIDYADRAFAIPLNDEQLKRKKADRKRLRRLQEGAYEALSKP